MSNPYDDWLRKHRHYEDLMQKLGYYEIYTHSLQPDQYASAWSSFSPMWNASHMYTLHNISVMMDELQAQIHEHAWPRSPD
eukprot:3590221-Rhodomonas_salina.1